MHGLAWEPRRALLNAPSAPVGVSPLDRVTTAIADCLNSPGDFPFQFVLNGLPVFRRGQDRRCRRRRTKSLAEGDLGGAQIELTADDLREIQGAVSQIEVHGARYSEAAQRMVGR